MSDVCVGYSVDVKVSNACRCNEDYLDGVVFWVARVSYSTHHVSCHGYGLW